MLTSGLQSVAARNGNQDEDEEDGGGRGGGHFSNGSQETIRNNNLHHGSSDSVVNEPFYDLPEGEDYMAIYETIDRKRQEVGDTTGFKARKIFTTTVKIFR